MKSIKRDLYFIIAFPFFISIYAGAIRRQVVKDFISIKTHIAFNACLIKSSALGLFIDPAIRLTDCSA